MPPALLFAALALAPPDAAEVVAVPPEEARREAEDLATFAVLLADAVTPLYADLDPPRVQSAILPGGDAVFLMDLPPVRADDAIAETPAADAEPLSAWEVSRLKAVRGIDLRDCGTCHGEGEMVPRSLWSDGETEAKTFTATAHALMDEARGRTVDRPAAPTRADLTAALRVVLADHAGRLVAVPVGGRVSVGVTVSPGATPDRAGGDGPRGLTDLERDAIAVAEAEAGILSARKDYRGAVRVLTNAISPLAEDVRQSDENGRRRSVDPSQFGAELAARFNSGARDEVVRVLRSAVDLQRRADTGSEAPSEPDAVRLGKIADAMEAARGSSPFPARLTVSAVRGSGSGVGDISVSVRDPAAAE